MVATVWSAMDMGCILTSICMLVIESMPPYAHHFKNDFDNIIPLNMAIYGMDVFINVFFTTDVVLRFIAEPGNFQTGIIVILLLECSLDTFFGPFSL